MLGVPRRELLRLIGSLIGNGDLRNGPVLGCLGFVMFRMSCGKLLRCSWLRDRERSVCCGHVRGSLGHGLFGLSSRQLLFVG